jgi:hypothetical protein
MRLPGRRRDMFEVGLMVQYHRAMMLGHGRREQVDHACGTMVTSRGHPNLNVTRPVGDRLAHRQYHVERSAALAYRADIGGGTAGVPGFKINGHTGGCGPIGDKPGDDVPDRGVVDPGVRRCVDQIELPGAGRDRHRRA